MHMRSTPRHHLWVFIASLLLGITIGVLPSTRALAQDATPVTTDTTSWPVYSADTSGTRALPSNLDTSTAPNLTRRLERRYRWTDQRHPCHRRWRGLRRFL